MRVTALVLAAALAWPTALPAAQPPTDPGLAAGIRQVEEGDFEGAIATLEPVVARLTAGGGAPAAQACLQLGIALLALDQREAALARFREALAFQPSLRLSPDRHSPKVLSAFDEARRAREAETRADSSAPQGKGHGTRNALILGGAAAAGVGVALAAGGDGGSSGTVTFTGARFGTPVLDCPNGASGTPLAVAIDLQAQNGTNGDVGVSASSAVLIIVASPVVTSEIGFASSAPATVMPGTLRPGSNAVRVQTTLTCANGPGDPSRFNEWRGRVTLTAGGSAQTIETADTMRVNLP